MTICTLPTDGTGVISKATVEFHCNGTGGADRSAGAVDSSLDRLAEVIGDPVARRDLLFGDFNEGVIP